MKSPPSVAKVHRISVSLPQPVFEELDKLVGKRGFESRSQAIAEMIHQSLTEHHIDQGNAVMAGTITLFYDESKPGLLHELADIQRRHVSEIIASHRVLLEHSQTMEIIVAQGPAQSLKRIADKLITCKGVKLGRLTFIPAILPQLHAHAKPAPRVASKSPAS